jgi:Tol biopolymer transport system component
MRYLKLFALFIISILIFNNESISQNKRPLEIEDMFRIKRVTDPQLSPDGRWIAYVITEVNKTENKSNIDLYLISSTGGEPKRLTTNPSSDANPRWSPDSKTIAFV